MNDKDQIISISEDLAHENLAFNKKVSAVTNTRLIVVQPLTSEIDDQVTPENPPVIPIISRHSLNNKNQSQRRHSSSDSIEEVDITPENPSENKVKRSSEIWSNKENKINKGDDNEHLSKENLRENENSSKAKLISLFEADALLEDLIMNPTIERGLIDYQTDLLRFVFTPPPKDVLVKCQLNKTNKIDKTLLFTNFIFSLQLPESISDSSRPCEPLMFGIPIKAASLSYFICTDPSEIHPSSTSVIGQIKTNFLGTRFNFYSKNLFLDSIDNDNSHESLSDETDSSSNLKDGRNHIGVIFYKNSKFGSKKPRSINVTIPSWNDEKGNYNFESSLPREMKEARNSVKDNATSLDNISPVYDDNQKRYTLNFGGRATEISVKNFALNMKIGNSTKRVFQFGKCKDHYIVDFTYPICAFQAFGIALSCCQRKIATD